MTALLQVYLVRRGETAWSLTGQHTGRTDLGLTPNGEDEDRLIARLRKMRGNVALFSHGQLSAALAARWIGAPLIHGQNIALHPASLSILGHESNHLERRVVEL